MLTKFYWLLLYWRNPWEKNFFFIKIFRPIRFREKIKFNWCTSWALESSEEWTLILTKSILPFIWSRKSIFLNENSLKFFHQSEFEKQWNSMHGLTAHWNRRRRQHRSRENPFCHLFQVISRFFSVKILQNFSTNQSSRKNQIQFLHFFAIGIERPVNTDAEKILLTFIWCL